MKKLIALLLAVCMVLGLMTTVFAADEKSNDIVIPVSYTHLDVYKRQSLANDAAGLPQTVRRRDILNAYPYTNTLTVLQITGAVLRRAMERSAEYFTRKMCIRDRA